MAKTIECIFHPRSLRMRQEIFKTRGVPGEGVGGGSGGGVDKGARGAGGGDSHGRVVGAGAVSTAAASTVLGKSRDDVQKICMDVLRDVSLRQACVFD